MGNIKTDEQICVLYDVPSAAAAMAKTKGFKNPVLQNEVLQHQVHNPATVSQGSQNEREAKEHVFLDLAKFGVHEANPAFGIWAWQTIHRMVEGDVSLVNAKPSGRWS